MTVYAEEDLIPLSALQRYAFCPRECALFHTEQIVAENRFTMEGRIQHERVDAGGTENRRDTRQAFGVALRSLRLGLSGKADVVEFHRDSGGVWVPYPVEHKRGRRKREDWDRIQLCAQAICLEEMLGVSVPEGALFYGKERRREVVGLDRNLREQVERVAHEVHDLLDSGMTPLPVYRPERCDNCSMRPSCLPEKVGEGRKVECWLRKMMEPPCDTT